MPEIKKGETYICIKALERSRELLYIEGQFYRSQADHSLVSENGTSHYGFNQEILEEHFVKV